MIPHTIHYCWFGGTTLPKSARRCIESWRRYFPGWEIRRWDESSCDVQATTYTADAYADGKYAFVSDYARFDILHRCGGIYFDTDVEVIRPFDDVVAAGPFMGMEKLMVNPGLGLGVEGGEPLLAEILAFYKGLSYAGPDGRRLPGTVVSHTTEILRRHGYNDSGLKQTVAGFTIYPNDWFNPLDDITGRLHITRDTHSIHHYAKTWCDDAGPVRTRLSRMAHRFVGLEASARIKRLFKL